MVNDIAVQDFVNAIKEQPTDNNTTYNATVSRIDSEGVVWVNLYGSDKETPTASSSAEVKRGDSITVEWRNNKLYIGGNTSNPAVGVARVEKNEIATEFAISSAMTAQEAADTAVSEAERAHAAADEAETHAQEAKGSAYNASEYASRALGNLSTVQSVSETLTWITQHGTMTLTTDTALDPTHVYFVRDANGDYEVGSYTYSIVAEPDVADLSTYYVLSIDESLNNYVGTHLALTGEGLWLLPASSGTNKVLVATGNGTTYTTAGTYLIDETGGTVASFRADGATIGENLSGQVRTNINADGMQIYRNNNGTDIVLANIGYGQGEGESGTSTAPYYTFGTRKTTTTAYSSSQTYNVGDLCVRSGEVLICTTRISTPEAFNGTHWRLATGIYSFTSGSNLIASGAYSHAEGSGTIALGQDAHAEGILTEARGNHSHAEGSDTNALGDSAHAEGSFTNANGDFTHAEGKNTQASGDYSHVQNFHTASLRRSQTVIGEYNKTDLAGTDHTTRGDYVFIIGNGDSNTSSNALTVDWSGNVDIASGATYSINGSSLIGWFYVNAITATTISATSTNTKVPITALHSGTGFAYDSTNKGIKCTSAGTYMVSCSVPFTTATSGDLMGIAIYKNGSAVLGPDNAYTRVGGNYDNAILFPTPIALAENDVLTLYVRNNTNGRGATGTGCRLSAWKVD